ncbi:MAG: hypothetical protein AB1439_05985 [candidate division FCPU426 bacterium]
MLRSSRCCLILMLAVAAAPAWAATPIYRSVGPGNNLPLATGGSNNLVISGTTAAFATGLPNAIGVGDVIQYDANGDGTVDALAFIHSRASSTSYQVRSASGGTPAACSGDQDWSVFRAYDCMDDIDEGAENPGVEPALRDFDPGPKNLTEAGSDEVLNVACYADAPDTVPAWWGDSWVTDSTHYIRVFTPVLPTEAGVSQRHTGRWVNGQGYCMEIDNEVSVRIYANHVRIEGLKFYHTNVTVDGTGQVWVRCNGQADVRVSHCLFRSVDSTTNDWHIGLLIWDAAGSGTVRVWNNVFFNFRSTANSEAMELDQPSFTCYMYNNTFINSTYGINLWNGQMVVKNNLAQGCTRGYYTQAGQAFSIASDYNISDLPNEAPGLHSKNNTLVTFIDPGNFDFHLSHTDLQARDAGQDLSTDVYLSLADDIDGEPRTAPWDIGADEDPVPSAALEWISATETILYLGTSDNLVGQLRYHSTSPDTLQALSVENTGTAEALADLAAVRLWYAPSGTVFDPGTSTLLGIMNEASPRQWGLDTNQTLQEGDNLFITADVLPQAQPGRTCQFTLLIGAAMFQVGTPLGRSLLINSTAQTIQPTVRYYLDFIPDAPVNVVKGTADIALGTVQVRNVSGQAFTLSSLSLALQDGKHQRIAWNSVFQRVEAQTEGRAPAALQLNTGWFFFNPAVVIPDQGTLSLAIAADMLAQPAHDTVFIGLNDGQSLNAGRAYAEPVPGKNYPLLAGPLHIRQPELSSSLRIYPNPCPLSAGPVQVSFYMEQTGKAVLRVLTLQGRPVKTLLDDNRSAGMQALGWDGRNDQGLRVRSGVYVLDVDVRFQDGTRRQLRRRLAVAN